MARKQIAKGKRVKNAGKNVTTKDLSPTGGGSWIDYWVYSVGADYPPRSCTAIDCNNKTTDGAHVYIEGETDTDKFYYVIPLCRACIKNEHRETEGWFEVNDITAVKVKKADGVTARGAGE